jgi:hypothetical protein
METRGGCGKGLVNKKARKPSEPGKTIRESEPSSPMDKFNNAMRKILAVPKKSIGKK